MKKLIICLLTIFACNALYCQRVKLSPNGIVDSDASTNSFVTFTVPNSGSTALFKGIKTYVEEYSENPAQAIIAQKEGAYLKFTTNVKGATMAETEKGYIGFDLKYNTELVIVNDSTVRMQFSNLIFSPTEAENAQLALVVVENGKDLYFFNKKGTLVQYDAKHDIDEHFNSRIFALKSAFDRK